MSDEIKYVERKIRKIYSEEGQKKALAFLDEVIQDYASMRVPPLPTTMIRLKMVRRMIQLDTLMAQSPMQGSKLIY